MRTIGMVTVVLAAALTLPAHSWSFEGLEASVACEGEVLAAAPEALEPPAAPTRELGQRTDHRKARDLGGGWDEAFYGVGFLHPRSQDGEIWTWERRATFPFYDAPDKRHLGWVVDGKVMPPDRPEAVEPLSWTGMIETGYETLTLMLREVRDDGWMEIRVSAPRPDDSGRVWVHACRLAHGEVALVPLLWSDVFVDSELPLSFRKQVPHALRVAPDAESERIAWLVDRDDLEALEVRGDWMRVRAYHPGKYFSLCGGVDEWKGQTLEGWVRWASPEKGTWLYWPTRGC